MSDALTSSTFGEVKHAWRWPEITATLLLGGVLLFTTLMLWPEWLHNPDLSHGLLTPLVFTVLLRDIFRGAIPLVAPARHCRGRTLVISLVGFGGLFFFVGANLYAAALEWTHSLVLWLLGVAMAMLVWATLNAFAEFRQKRFPRWPVVVAGLLWMLSAPIPPGTYTRLTQSLQSVISVSVLTSLHFFGVAAERIGNVINLAHVSVGVEEACSGVRSLISCLFAALFLSAVSAHRTSSRVVLVLAAAPLAIGMNFLRSLALTLLANDGVSIQGFWHDVTGFAVLGLTALLLFTFARTLEGTKPSVIEKGPQPLVSEKLRQGKEDDLARSPALQIANALLVLTLGTWLLFAIKTRPRPSSAHRAILPEVNELIPASAPGWTVTTRNDLYQFSSELRTRFLAERSFTRTVNGAEQQVTIYIAFWPAGQVPVSLVEAHTPDACWPGGGWVEDTRRHQHLSLQTGSYTLPSAEFRTFQLQSYPQNVWYWHLFDGQVIEQTEANSPRRLLSLAWHYGFRKDGDQYFVRISSNLPWEQIAKEPLLRDTIDHLKTIGL